MNTISLQIQNLKCGGCATTIDNKLTKLVNISNIDVDVEHSIVTFDYTDDLALATVKESLKSIGYPVEGEENSMVSKAKSYVSCAIGKIS